MYRGVNHVAIGQQFVGENIDLEITTSYTPNYDDDEPTPTKSTTTVRAQVTDLSNKEREMFETEYDTNKMIALYVKKGTSVNQDDYFTYNSIKYTIIQIQNGLNYTKLYCKFDNRME